MTQNDQVSGRVLHVLKYYRPTSTGEGVFLERSSAVMQEIAPGTEHDLLVTHTPRPGHETAACTTLSRVVYLASRKLGSWGLHVTMALWLVANMHRYRTIHFRDHVDRYFLCSLLARIAGRRLVLSATPGNGAPALLADYEPGLRHLATRGFGLFHAVIGASPDVTEATRQMVDASRCHLIPRSVADPEHAPDDADQPRAAAHFGMRGTASRYLGLYGTPAQPHSDRETGLDCTASIFDERFHNPVAIDPRARPLLMTMVDAEEDFDWAGPFRRDAVSVASMGEQWRAHRIFERHGVVPLYLADHPVAVQDAGRVPLRDFLRSGACEIGAQMHPWVTPPFDEALGERNSYAGNLPVDLEFAKARHLTRVLEDNFGEAPRIYRTGRFGAGPRTADILKALGYEADSSVTPCWPPDNIARAWLSAKPYWADRERRLMEIPVSAALVGRLSQSTGLAPTVFHPRAQRWHVSGAMSRLGLMERIRLSPEGMTIAEAKRLTRHMLAAGHRAFVLTYHSPSLAPGNTPYVRTPEDLARFLAWLDEYYAFFAEEAGGYFGSWRDLRYGALSQTAMAAQ